MTTHKEALKHEINLVLTDPDTNLSHGAKRALDYVLGQLEALAQPEQLEGLQLIHKADIDLAKKRATEAQPEQEPTCKQYLQVEQEPVAFMDKEKFEYLKKNNAVLTTVTSWGAFDDDVALYTTPPQRTWVGLTEAEANNIYKGASTFGEMMRMVEAKLKEKNT